MHCLVYFIISFWRRFIYNTAYISLQRSSWGVLFILQLLINHFRGRVSGADGAPLSLHCGPWQHLLIRDASQNLSCTILSRSPSTDLSSAIGSLFARLAFISRFYKTTICHVLTLTLINSASNPISYLSLCFPFYHVIFFLMLLSFNSLGSSVWMSFWKTSCCTAFILSLLVSLWAWDHVGAV